MSSRSSLHVLLLEFDATQTYINKQTEDDAFFGGATFSLFNVSESVNMNAFRHKKDEFIPPQVKVTPPQQGRMHPTTVNTGASQQ